VTTTQPGRRRLDAGAPTPYEVPTREPRVSSPRVSRLLRLGTIALLLLGTIGSVTAIVDVPAPGWLWRPSAALLLFALAVALTHRAGGHLRIWGSLAGLLAVSAAATGLNLLLASAAGATAVLAAVVAVMYTRPAPTTRHVLLEFGVMLVLTLSGAAGVAAWNASVNPRTFGLLVLVVSIVLTLAIVWRLGSGQHGLGRPHLKVLLAAAAVAVGLFVYASYVRTSASPGLQNLIDDSIVWMRQNVGGVPRPYEFLIGFPALILGTSMRSRYREGWWVCVLAVVGTAIVTASLIDPRAYPTYFLLSTAYSALIALVIGLPLRAIFVRTRSSARRAARVAQRAARTEPGRFEPLK